MFDMLFNDVICELCGMVEVYDGVVEVWFEFE